MSAAEAPTRTLNQPGSTTRFMATFHRESSDGGMVTVTVRLSPGGNSIFSNPASRITGVVTDDTSSRMYT